MVLGKDHQDGTCDTPDLNPVGSYVTIDFIAGFVRTSVMGLIGIRRVVGSPSCRAGECLVTSKANLG